MRITDEMVERAAEALARHQGNRFPDNLADMWRGMARAALEAVLTEPEGRVYCGLCDGWMAPEYARSAEHVTRDNDLRAWEYGYGSQADAAADRPTMRRRKAGPWEPVEP